MSREIRSITTSNTTAAPNDFKDRLVKLIPTEIVTAYISILGLIRAAAIPDDTNIILQWVVFGLLLSLTPFYLFHITQVKKIAQIIFTTIAFVIWVIVVGGPFSSLIDNEQLTSLLGSILLIIYTLLIPFFYKG
jgi:hypothetical protein